MKLLRETIRRLIIEAYDDPSDDFIRELEKRFEKRPFMNHYRLAKVYPDGCEVHFWLERLEGVSVWFHELETIGDDCIRKGYAKDTMQSILDLADEMGIYLQGELDPFTSAAGGFGDRPDAQGLAKFYRSMGWEVREADGEIEYWNNETSSSRQTR